MIILGTNFKSHLFPQFHLGMKQRNCVPIKKLLIGGADLFRRLDRGMNEVFSFATPALK